MIQGALQTIYILNTDAANIKKILWLGPQSHHLDEVYIPDQFLGKQIAYVESLDGQKKETVIVINP